MKRFLFAGAAIAVLLLWKFVVGPSLFVDAQNAVGAGWNDAKEDFMSQYVATFTEEFAIFQLPAGVIEQIADCTTDKSIEFLGTTDCSYLYSEATTTEEEHLQAQEMCFIESGYEAKEEEFSIACMKTHFPNDWKHVRLLILEMFTAEYAAAGFDAARVEAQAECMTRQTLSIVQKRGCPLINRDARRAEQLLFTVDDCVEDPDNDPEYQAAITVCQAEKLPTDTAVEGDDSSAPEPPSV